MSNRIHRKVRPPQGASYVTEQKVRYAEYRGKMWVLHATKGWRRHGRTFNRPSPEASGLVQAFWQWGTDKMNRRFRDANSH